MKGDTFVHIKETTPIKCIIEEWSQKMCKWSIYTSVHKPIPIILKIFSVALARTGAILPIVREITHIKTYNFRIKSRMCKKVYCHRKRGVNMVIRQLMYKASYIFKLV
jgi:hypothetical protein